MGNCSIDKFLLFLLVGETKSERESMTNVPTMRKPIRSAQIYLSTMQSSLILINKYIQQMYFKNSIL